MRETAEKSLHLTQIKRGQRNSSLWDTYLDKLFYCLHNITIELLDLHSCQVHVAEQTVDDLKQRQLHVGDAFI